MPTDPTSLVADRDLAALRARLTAAEPDLLADLERLVNVDCGSYTRDGVNEVAAWTADFLARLGGDVTRHADPAGALGDTVEAVFRGAPGGPRALLIGHTDTVFPVGTVAERPFRVADGIATGPGVTDMKAGLLTLLYGLQAVLATGGLPFERLTVIANPDEEIGSPVSTPHVRRGAAPTPGSSPRRDAARSWRRRTRSSASMRSRAAGPASRATWVSSRAEPARTSWPSASSSRSTCGRWIGPPWRRQLPRSRRSPRLPRSPMSSWWPRSSTATGRWRSCRARSGSWSTRRHSPRGWASPFAMPRPEAHRMPTRPRGWASRRSTAWARSVAWTTPGTSGWTPRASSRGRRSSRPSSSRPGATRRSWPGGPAHPADGRAPDCRRPGAARSACPDGPGPGGHDDRHEQPHEEVPSPGHERGARTASYTHLRAHETRHDLVCRLLL